MPTFRLRLPMAGNQFLVLTRCLWLSVVFLTGCATETIPRVRVKGNTSSIEMGGRQAHGPQELIGSIGEPPNIPSGVSISIRRLRPLHNKEPRYFIPASGRLQIVS